MRNARHPVFLAGVAVAAVTGVASVVRPFTYDVSPLDTLRPGPDLGEVWHLGAPFFLSIGILIGSLRWVAAKRFTLLERGIWFGLGAVSTFITFRLLTQLGGPGPNTSQDRLMIWLPLVIIVAGWVLVILSWCKDNSASFGPVAAMQVAYVANGAMCLTMFQGSRLGWQDGAYLTLVTCLVYSLQVALPPACPPEVAETRLTEAETPTAP